MKTGADLHGLRQAVLLISEGNMSFMLFSLKKILAGSAPGRSRLGLSLLLLICLCGFFGGGCRSTGKESSGSLASVVIAGNTPGQISYMAAEVFSENGYLVAKRGPDKLVFEKKGSTMNNIAYGNWIGDTPVWVRVKATIVPVAENTFQLQCNAYLLRDRGGPTEEEIKVNGLHSRPYQKLLDEVARRFNR